jgi:cobalt-zinc-cadmium efflux system membrane fusion protein
VHVGDPAEITLNAFPDRVFKGTVSNILPILDPSIRTGKVRIEVANPGMMKVGMFVTATFQGKTEQTFAAVPASAILHLHDRDWVYVPAPGNKFRRVMVVGGDLLPGACRRSRRAFRSDSRWWSIRWCCRTPSTTSSRRKDLREKA